LKRKLGEGDEAADREETAPQKPPIVVAAREDGNTVGHEVKPKYHDAVTGDTWTGRGRMASWLKSTQDEGEDVEKYRV